MPLKLKDKVVVVTGGAEGLGCATALKCAEAGGRVIVADINLDGAENTARTIINNGGRARAVPVDLTQEDQVAGLMEQTRNAFGHLDILINCAGILLSAGQRVDQFSSDSWSQVIAVNLSGTFFCIKHAVSLLEKSGGVYWFFWLREPGFPVAPPQSPTRPVRVECEVLRSA